VNIEINEDLSYKGALLNFKYEWAKKQLVNGTITGTAKRLNISRKMLQLLNKLTPDDFNKMVVPKYRCIFCQGNTDIRLHHIDGQKHSGQTEAICEKCHKLFHSLSSRYKR